MMTFATSVQGEFSVRLAIFTPETGASDRFAVFKYGTEEDMTNVFLTVEQTVALAARFADAVAAFHPVAA